MHFDPWDNPFLFMVYFNPWQLHLCRTRPSHPWSFTVLLSWGLGQTDPFVGQNPTGLMDIYWAENHGP